METIKKTASRYIVPFYYDAENGGYDRLVNKFKEENAAAKYDLSSSLPKDCRWRQAGFWENYRSPDNKLPEMDIYTYLLRIFKNTSSENNGYVSDLGCSFVLGTNGSVFKLQYIDRSKDIYEFRCSDLGILLFRNGTGFVWYDIKLSKSLDIETYIRFHNAFKELARTHDRKIVKKTGKDTFEDFCMGQWIANLLCADQYGIGFWAERTVIKNGQQLAVPDKALLFNFLFVNGCDDERRRGLAFLLANGYDEKYIPPRHLAGDIYEPFGNICFYTSIAGTACVVSDDDSNETFFAGNFEEKFLNDHFFINVLLLYQSYSCTHYSRLLTRLPAKLECFDENPEYVDALESLSSRITLFLVKSVYESVSSIPHQNGVYEYGRRALSLEENINSLTIGLDALNRIEQEKVSSRAEEREKEQAQLTEKRDRALNRGLAIFGFLVVISAAVDAVNLVDWFTQSAAGINAGHILLLVFIALLTIYLIAVLIVNTIKQHEKKEHR